MHEGERSEGVRCEGERGEGVRCEGERVRQTHNMRELCNTPTLLSLLSLYLRMSIRNWSTSLVHCPCSARVLAA